ncbi:hypothetical protein [Paraconexibacter sp.]|uniref:hypothetical protein n=1 Tax=Paraconexibacter sp. TaxID=2949640 RepID=UPI003567DE55
MTLIKRTDGLIVERAGEELLVYDQRTQAAHCLSPVAAEIWQACETVISEDELAARTGYDRATVEAAVHELTTRDLLHVTPPAVTGQTRRQALRTLTTSAAATAAAGLTITSILAPTAAQAATKLASGQPCTTSSQCDSGLCNAGTCA